MLNKMITKAAEIKKAFEDNHGILAYVVEFILSIGMTFGSTFISLKLTRQTIDKIAEGRELDKVTSFILSMLTGFIPTFIGSFVSAVTMPNERVLKAGIINRERDRRDRELSHENLSDISDEELFSGEGEEA